MNLDIDKKSLPIVKAYRDVVTANGCKVSLCFRTESDVQIKRAVAEMLLATSIKRRSDIHEASFMPVQSIHERTSG